MLIDNNPYMITYNPCTIATDINANNANVLPLQLQPHTTP